MTRLLTLALALSLTGCSKKVPLNVAGSDDELLDQYAAKLEELRSRAQGELTCQGWQEIASKGCDLSLNICQVSKRHRDRPDIDQRCVSSQEDCAQFNDRSAHCTP